MTIGMWETHRRMAGCFITSVTAGKISPGIETDNVSSIDKQIVNRLLKMHQEMLGPRADNYCRWYYDGNTDIYHCSHTAFYGKDVISGLPNQPTDVNPAKVDWDNNPDSLTHTI